MTDAPRCEPPKEWRDRDGWHWVRLSNDSKPVCMPWDGAAHRWWQSHWPSFAYKSGWRYLSPVTSAAEVEALRAELAASLEMQAQQSRQNVWLCERVAELEGALHDMRAGWRYIRREHGDLYGVGWDRCEQSATAALEPKP